MSRLIGPTLPRRGERFVHSMRLRPNARLPYGAESYETCVVTSARRDYYGPIVYYTTAEAWDAGARHALWGTHHFQRSIREWLGARPS